MKARLRDHLPLRFQNAVTLARRALQCERLESRCLMHAMPLANQFDADPVESEPQSAASSVPVLVQQPLAQDAYSSPAITPPAITPPASDGNNPSSGVAQSSEIAGGPLAQTPVSDGSDSLDNSRIQDAQPAVEDKEDKDESSSEKEPEKPIDLGDLKAEGEGAPAVESFPAKGTGGTRGSIATDVSDSSLPARASGPLGNVDSSLAVGRVSNTSDATSDLGAPTDRSSHNAVSSVALTSNLGLTSDETTSTSVTSTQAEKSGGNPRGIGLSLNPDIQTQSYVSQSSLSPSLQGQGLATRGAPLQNLSATSWLLSSADQRAGNGNADWSFATDGHVVDAMRSIDGEDDTDLRSPRFVSDSTDRAALEAEVATTDDDNIALYALRVALEQDSRERQAERAGFSSGMRHEASRHSRGYVLQAYLRVREGSDGLVELAVEHSPTLDDYPVAYPGEPAGATADRSWSDGSMGLYREFDLADDAAEPSRNFSSESISPASILVDESDVLEAVDAVHASEDASADSVSGTIHEATLPLGLLALSSLLAVSRHRFARKQRQDD